MATNIGTELRRLLKKLGGTPSKYDQTNELIHKITDQVEPGGGGATFVELTFAEDNSITSTVKAGALWEAVTTGPVIFVAKTEGAIDFVSPIASAAHTGTYRFNVKLLGGETILLSANTADDYPYMDGDS